MRVSLVFVLLMFTTLTACKKLRELTRFTVSDTSYATIPSGGVINLPFRINTPDVQTNASQEYESNNTRADLVRTAFLTEVKISIYSPNSADFDFLRSLEVFIAASGLEEKRIAYINNIPQTALKTINLTTEPSIDLKEYLKNETYQLRIQAVTRQLPGSDVTLEIASRYLVEADVF